MNRRTHSVTLLQATQDSPNLARLSEIAMDSAARLTSIQFLIPLNLRSTVKGGPIEGAQWCLILDNHSVAAKIRQLLPSMQAHLRSNGWEVNSIRLKIRGSKEGV